MIIKSPAKSSSAFWRYVITTYPQGSVTPAEVTVLYDALARRIMRVGNLPEAVAIKLLDKTTFGSAALLSTEVDPYLPAFDPRTDELTQTGSVVELAAHIKAGLLDNDLRHLGLAWDKLPLRWPVLKPKGKTRPFGLADLAVFDYGFQYLVLGETADGHAYRAAYDHGHWRLDKRAGGIWEALNDTHYDSAKDALQDLASLV